MKSITFPCLGGPLNGHWVSEQYAGPEYSRYNSANKITPPHQKTPLKDHFGRWEYYYVHQPRCVLVHESIWPDPSSTRV